MLVSMIPPLSDSDFFVVVDVVRFVKLETHVFGLWYTTETLSPVCALPRLVCSRILPLNVHSRCRPQSTFTETKLPPALNDVSYNSQ